jgi:hypothetical protein
MEESNQAFLEKIRKPETQTLKSILVDIVNDPGKMRLNDVGDWQDPANGNYLVIVADLGNDDMTFALALHEAVEAYLCHKNGVSSLAVDKWDNEVKVKDRLFAGDDPEAPYHKEHVAALAVERAFAESQGIDWTKYELVLDAGVYKVEEAHGANSVPAKR